MSDAQVNTVPPQPTVEDNLDVQSEEEPTLDAETLRALKNCSIDDEIARADFSKKDKKTKSTKKSKKTNAKKGQDFLDLAQEKGIELKIQYEDKEENKKPYYQKDNNFNPKFSKYNNNNYNNQKGNEYNNNFNKDGNQNGTYKKNFYNKGGYNKYPKNNFHFQNKSKNNKFDQANGMMFNPMMYGQMRPNMMNQFGMNPHAQGQYAHQNQPQQEMDPFFVGERSVEEVLSYVFSPEFLNKEVYIRKRIGADGLIELYHVLNYNKIKAKGITAEQIKSAIANLNPSPVEFYESEGKNYIKINDWQNVQSQLMTVEQIQMQKRTMRNQRYQSNMNYIALQNNYFFPPNNPYHMGQMPGVMPGMIDQIQPNPYMMPPMGQMNLPPFQQNFMPGMTPQFQAPSQEDVTQTPQN